MKQTKENVKNDDRAEGNTMKTKKKKKRKRKLREMVKKQQNKKRWK